MRAWLPKFRKQKNKEETKSKKEILFHNRDAEEMVKTIGKKI